MKLRVRCGDIAARHECTPLSKWLNVRAQLFKPMKPEVRGVRARLDPRPSLRCSLTRHVEGSVTCTSLNLCLCLWPTMQQRSPPEALCRCCCDCLLSTPRVSDQHMLCTRASRLLERCLGLLLCRCNLDVMLRCDHAASPRLVTCAAHHVMHYRDMSHQFSLWTVSNWFP